MGGMGEKRMVEKGRLTGWGSGMGEMGGMGEEDGGDEAMGGVGSGDNFSAL